VSRYYSPKLRKQIADGLELAMMSHVTGRSYRDPMLESAFMSRIKGFQDDSICVFRSARAVGVPYALAKVAYPSFVGKDGTPTNFVIFDSRGRRYSFEGPAATHAIYCMRNVGSLRVGSFVDMWSKHSKHNIKSLEKKLVSLFESAVNVLVLDSAKFTYRVDDHDLDPEEEGGVGGEYLYGKREDALYDIFSPGSSPAIVTDALEMRTRWVRTTFIKAAAYFTGDSVSAFDQDRRVMFRTRALALEPVSKNPVGRHSMWKFHQRSEENVGTGYEPMDLVQVERMLEGDSFVTEDDLWTIREMGRSTESYYGALYEKASGEGGFRYDMPYRTLKL